MLLNQLRKLALVVSIIIAVALTLSSYSILNASQSNQIQIGLITKTETNPFFVKMKEGAQAVADKLGAKLLTAAGKNDNDNESQVTAIENMVNAGVKGILLVPANSAGIVPAVAKARAAGVLVIALDTPADPQDATDALFATDNMKAGLLIGQYAKAVFNGKKAIIATLDAAPGNKTGVLRHNGFLQGFGIKEGDPSIVCSGDSGGDQALGQTLMENCLTKNPDINLVYAINEPAAAGAHTALDKAGKAKGVTVVAVDGGCTPGITSVIAGDIAATSQQYPLKMAAMGVEAVVKFAKDGTKPTGYTDTGVTLISAKPVAGVDSQGSVFGAQSCWGTLVDGEMDAAMKADAAAGIKPPAAAAPAAASQIQIGLITKTETNPFFVKMKEGAQAVADKLGAKLLTAAGKNDNDNESQVTAIENMVNAGVKGILLVPANSAGIVPAVAKARAAGVLVIALDTPADPQDATDALFATDNMKAGLLIGQYAKAVFNGKKAIIATLDAAPGNKTGVLRHNGFLQGFGIKEGDPSIVCSGDSGGDQALGQTLMENCLTKNPDINLVYAINEPAAAGAHTALDKAGKAKGVTVVAVDGGCTPGITSVIAGDIAATSQQYPLKMAAMGVEAVVKFAKDGTKPTGYTDTGVTLISAKPVAGVDSQGSVFGAQSCWGTLVDGEMDAAMKADAAAGIKPPAAATMAPTASK